MTDPRIPRRVRRRTSASSSPRCSSSAARSRRSSISTSCCTRFRSSSRGSRSSRRSPSTCSIRSGDELTIAYSVGYPDDVARTLRVKVGHGLVGAAVAEGQPILVNDVHADPRYVEAVPGSNARAGRAAAPQGPRDRRAQPAQRHRRAVHRDRRSDAAPVRRARRGRDRERAALRARARVHEHARDAGRDRPRVRRHSQSRRAADAHRQPDAPRDRLPHLRHPAGQRGDAGARDEGRGPLRRTRSTLPRVKLGDGLVGYAALHKEPVLVPDVVGRSALHQGGRRRAVGAGDSAAAARIAASACSISRARSSTPSPRATSRS